MLIATFTAPACLTEDLVVSRVGSGDPKRETIRKPTLGNIHCEGSLELSSRRNLRTCRLLWLYCRESGSLQDIQSWKWYFVEEKSETGARRSWMSRRWRSDRSLGSCVWERGRWVSEYKYEVITKRTRDPILLWWTGKSLRENSLSLLLSFYSILFQFGPAPCELNDNVSYFFWNRV